MNLEAPRVKRRNAKPPDKKFQTSTELKRKKRKKNEQRKGNRQSSMDEVGEQPARDLLEVHSAARDAEGREEASQTMALNKGKNKGGKGGGNFVIAEQGGGRTKLRVTRYFKFVERKSLLRVRNGYPGFGGGKSEDNAA